MPVRQWYMHMIRSDMIEPDDIISNACHKLYAEKVKPIS